MFNGYALRPDAPRVRRAPTLDGVIAPDEPVDLTFVEAVERRAAGTRGRAPAAPGWTPGRMFAGCACLFGAGLLVLGVVAALFLHAR